MNLKDHGSWRAALRGCAAILAVLSLLACRSGPASDPERRPPVGSEVGHTAPSLEGRLPSGDSFRLRTDAGPTVLVFFLGEHCGLCRERLQQLDDHLEEYRALGASVLAVTPEPPAVTAGTVRRLGLRVPVLSVDSGQLARWSVLDGDGAMPLPATYVVNEAGVIAFRHVGRNAADRTTDAGLLAVLGRRSRSR